MEIYCRTFHSVRLAVGKAIEVFHFLPEFINVHLHLFDSVYGSIIILEYRKLFEPHGVPGSVKWLYIPSIYPSSIPACPVQGCKGPKSILDATGMRQGINQNRAPTHHRLDIRYLLCDYAEQLLLLVTPRG